jgi:hypothetical protein
MLSSIHPLGERARDNRWAVTVGAFTLASTLIGAMVGLILGWAGSRVLPPADPGDLLLATGVTLLATGFLDAARVRPPGPDRQVNESWIGHYRGWVYGGAFGAQLGAGLATYVVTWGVYAVAAVEFLAGDRWRGALIGAVFGLGRSLALLLAHSIDRPSRLTAFHHRMARLGPPVHRGASLGAVAAGAVAWVLIVT